MNTRGRTVAGEDAGLPIDIGQVSQLAKIFSRIDLSGDGPPPVPWGNRPSAESFRAALDAGRDRLPAIYQPTYIKPLETRLKILAGWNRRAGTGLTGETLLGAVYQHGPGSPVASPLRRLLAVTGHLHETFMGDEKRRMLGLPTAGAPPPLAAFRHSGSVGPFTFPARLVKLMAGAAVDVVSLPSTYREHPVIWASLSHEIGGHSILYGVGGLIDELGEGVWRLIAGRAASLGSELAVQLAHLWRFWVDEAAADVLGLLNLGPSFALNLIPWLSALRAESELVQAPHVLTSTLAAPGHVLDTHPTDILRIHLAYGVTAKLGGLNAASRQRYLNALEELAATAAGGATELRVAGMLKLPTRDEMPFDVSVPLGVVQETAALVGGYIADTPFRALNGLSFQSIRTWEDADEAATRRAAGLMAEAEEPETRCGAAHLLAGATLALVADPGSYGKVTDGLNERLGECVRRDLWTFADS